MVSKPCKAVVVAAVVAVVCLLPLLLLLSVEAAADLEPLPWSYTCAAADVGSGACSRVLAGPGDPVVSLQRCKLSCGNYGSLWPLPTGETRLGQEVSNVTIDNIRFKIEPSENVMMTENYDIFLKKLKVLNPTYNESTPSDLPSAGNLDIQITISSPTTTLDLTTDETYTLTISEGNDGTEAKIDAVTQFGARHGLETLSQLIIYDEHVDSFQIMSTASITDGPKFPYRGLLIDTSRNFISLENLRLAVDAMSYNKLNMLHWHITDTASFPLETPSRPNMLRYGAYSSRQTYSTEEVRELVAYGRTRGVLLLPEIDSPAHVAQGWQWGPQEGLGDLVVCLDVEPWSNYAQEPPTGQLNIANTHMYDVLGDVYADVVDAFGDVPLFHFGGDEVNLKCWNSSEEIKDWMTANGSPDLTSEDYHKVWAGFHAKAYDGFKAANSNKDFTGIIWTNTLTSDTANNLEYIPKEKYVVQVWTTGTDSTISDLLGKGYRLIFSNYDAWYLDCGFSAWIGGGSNWCPPYKGWQTVYDNDPVAMAGDHVDQVMGGEAALWTEQTDDQDLQRKLWPRGAALAERLWSAPPSGFAAAEYRLVHQRSRLVARGVPAEGVQPQWCHEHAGACRP